MSRVWCQKMEKNIFRCRLIKILIGLSITIPAYGNTVYKCETTNGSTYYQAKYCKNTSDIQAELNCYNSHLSKKAIEQIEKNLQHQRKSLIKKQKLKQREDLNDAKKAKAQEKKKLRLKAKCEKIKQQIDEVTQHYRTGYTIKQGIVLDRKLSDYQKQRQKYCNYE